MSCPVAAIVVAFESGRVLPACLAALEGKVSRAVVVDNSRTRSACPQLRERHSWVTWIDNDSNRGLAGAVNQGVAATTEPFVLLLNPDCELQTGLGPLVEACRLEGVAGASGVLEDLDGNPQIGFLARSLPTASALVFEVLGINRIWRGNPVNRHYRLLGLDPSREREVQQPAGAFLMLRRDALRAIGGMDENFHPVWFEDVDLCQRFHDARYVLRLVPAAVARHHGGHSVGNLPLQARLEAWYGGLLRYAEKHYPWNKYRWVWFSVVVGLNLRKLVSLTGGESSANASAYEAARWSIKRAFPKRPGAC